MNATNPEIYTTVRPGPGASGFWWSLHYVWSDGSRAEVAMGAEPTEWAARAQAARFMHDATHCAGCGTAFTDWREDPNRARARSGATLCSMCDDAQAMWGKGDGR